MRKMCPFRQQVERREGMVAKGCSQGNWQGCAKVEFHMFALCIHVGAVYHELE